MRRQCLRAVFLYLEQLCLSLGGALNRMSCQVMASGTLGHPWPALWR
ncbi:hypothetical protein [Desulfosporosinus sp. BG]|nr:hypothetical protein [Desulfosporosinus sp. BG]ODA41539.1 hypothetical protein DSBG_1649 [Desulfosporosinus sp. BG]